MYKNGPILWNFTIKIICISIRFHSDNYDWEPKLHPYQQLGSNVLFFTFINPSTMDVPVAFKKLGMIHFIMIWISNIQTVKLGKRKFYFQPRPDARTWKEQFPVIHVSYLQSEGKYKKNR